LSAHQHTLQAFKNTILSRNVDQNMLKNVLFFEKSWNYRRSVGGSAPKPRWLPTAGPDPQVVIPTQFTCYFKRYTNILASLKYDLYLSDG